MGDLGILALELGLEKLQVLGERLVLLLEVFDFELLSVGDF